jgi:transposase-like protein
MSEDYKLSVVDYYLTEDNSQLETCRIFKCTPRSLIRWVKRYKKRGECKYSL